MGVAVKALRRVLFLDPACVFRCDKLPVWGGEGQVSVIKNALTD